MQTGQMRSHHQVQQVWDSFVSHLKSLSESVQTAHDVFSHSEDDVKVTKLSLAWSIQPS